MVKLKQTIKEKWITVAGLMVFTLFMFLIGSATSPHVGQLDTCERRFEDCLNQAAQGKQSNCLTQYEDSVDEALDSGLVMIR